MAYRGNLGGACFALAIMAGEVSAGLLSDLSW